MKRSHKKMDPDFKALKRATLALLPLSPRMQRATLEYLWDRFVAHPRKPGAGGGT